MKRIISITIIILAIILLFLPVTLFYIYGQDYQATKIDGKLVDTLLLSELSPDGKHCLNVYSSEGKHATVGDACAVIVSAEESGKRWKGKEAWTLFFGFYGSRGYFITAKWIDDETVLICNEAAELKLNIYQDEFY